MPDETTDVQIARLQEQLRAQQVDVDASRAARGEYIPRIQAIESGIGSLALSMSDLTGSVNRLEVTINKMDERLKVPEMQSAEMWKERARVFKYLAGILAGIIISVGTYLIVDLIKSRRNAAPPISPPAITGTVTGTATATGVPR